MQILISKELNDVIWKIYDYPDLLLGVLGFPDFECSDRFQSKWTRVQYYEVEAGKQSTERRKAREVMKATVWKRFYFAKTATTLRTLCLRVYTFARQNRFACMCSYMHCTTRGRGRVGPPYCNAMYLAPSTVYKPSHERRFQTYPVTLICSRPLLPEYGKKGWNYIRKWANMARETPRVKSPNPQSSRSSLNHPPANQHLIFFLFNYARKHSGRRRRGGNETHRTHSAKVVLILGEGEGNSRRVEQTSWGNCLSIRSAAKNLGNVIN